MTNDDALGGTRDLARLFDLTRDIAQRAFRREREHLLESLFTAKQSRYRGVVEQEDEAVLAERVVHRDDVKAVEDRSEISDDPLLTVPGEDTKKIEAIL